MSKSLCVIDESPALLPLPRPPLCWTSLAFLPSSKIYMFSFFFLFIENKKITHLTSSGLCPCLELKK